MNRGSDWSPVSSAGRWDTSAGRIGFVGFARSDQPESAALAPAKHHAPGSGPPGPLAVIIPVKRLDQAKSRLARRLEFSERAALVRRLLERALGAVQESGLFGTCLVVSADPTVRAWAQAAGAHPVDEAAPGTADSHNGALEAARATLAGGTAGLLVLSADLPLITAADLRAMVLLATTERSIVLAPDRAETGTNALFLRPPDALAFHFGVDSFRRHRAAAAARGLAVQIYRSPGTAFDLDLPEHLDELGLLG